MRPVTNNLTPHDITPSEVAQTLQAYQKNLPPALWLKIKELYKKARQSYSPTMALEIAERAVLRD